MFPAFFLSIGLLIALHIKRKESPINLILLAAFTVVEAYTVGVLVTFFDQSVVIQAFFLTAAVVIGLTAFTFQVGYLIYLQTICLNLLLIRLCNMHAFLFRLSVTSLACTLPSPPDS